MEDISQIKEQIGEGTYVTPYKLAIVIEKITAALEKPLTTEASCGRLVTHSKGKPMRFRYPDKPVETGPEHFDLPFGQLALWIAQRKYDGWRMPVFVDSANTIRCLSRSNKPIRRAYRGKVPDELEASFVALALPDDTVLDTEFVGPRGGHPVGVWVFDCLAWRGNWLVREPYEDRWGRCLTLANRLHPSGLIHLAETVYPTAQDMENLVLAEFWKLRQEWLELGGGMDYLYEGVVIKRRSGGLILSNNDCANSPHMFKLRFRDIDEQRY